MSEVVDPIARHMCSFVSCYVQAHGAAADGVRTDLGQLGALLDDAVLRLTTSFAAITAMTDAPAGIGVEIGEMVGALQFHDLVTQIVARSLRRIDAIDRMNERLARLPDASLADLDCDAEAVPSSRESQAVTQRRMTTGTVELF